MKITAITTKRPVTTFMFFLAIVLLGFVSLRELSVDLLPDISYPRISVVTQYSGVAPEEIETLVTQPLEAAVSRIPGLRRVESVSKEGFSYMTLEFAWGTDMDFAILHTREKLDSARFMLPEDTESPNIIPLDPQSKPIMVLAISGEGTLLEFKEFSEEVIKPRLEQIEGIGSAEIAGGVEREIQVEVDPNLLSLYGLTIDQISQRIEYFNSNLQGGTIMKGKFRYALRVVGEFELLSEIGEISLKTTNEGGVIRLKDVARIKDSIKEREGVTKLNEKESIGILVRKESGANTVKVTRVVHEIIGEIENENPGIEILVVSEQAKYIENAISSVLKSIIYGGILAFLVLFVFLQDLNTPIIIAVVIPISIIATFNLLYFMDITLNIMSLGGLALGVGMLVDNSIVVSESIFRHNTLGKSLMDAAYTGTKEVGMAVTASTLTTISVFLPVLYVHGVAGQLFKDQALTVTFALLSSLIVSLTLLPMLASRKFDMEKKPEEMEEKRRAEESQISPKKKSKFKFLLYPYLGIRWLVYFMLRIVLWVFNFLTSYFLQLFILIFHYLSLPFKPLVILIFKGFNSIYEKFSHRYHQFLIWSLDNKAKVLAGSLVFLVLTLLLATQIPRELMPKPEAESFEVNLKTPIDYSLEQTVDVVSSIERWLGERESLTDFFSQIGIVSGMESLNPDISLNSAQIYVEVQGLSQLDDIIEALRKRLEKFPGLSFSIVKEQSTIAQFLAFAKAEIGLKIRGEDLIRLKIIAEQLVASLRSVRGIADINTNIGEGKPEFLIKIRKEAFEKYNISPSEIGNFLINAVRGKVASQFKELEKKYDILVRLDEATRENIESLLDEQILYRGTPIPLRELVYYEIAKGPREIRRENQQREVIVTANLRGRKISQVVPLIQEKIDGLSLPSGYRVVFSGEQEEMSQSFRSLIFAFSLAVLLVYMIMAAQFESLLHPFLILFTLPMGLTGAIWALFLTGQTINVISVIGTVVLAGIVVNDAIVKIDYTNQLRKKGMPLREAVMEASRVRLRPILMTTVTTAFGLFPMSLGLGRGSELQQPLAISVIGGLILATFLTLILIPVAYELGERRKEKGSGLHF
ncbi:MAG: efflux RND transporter permease subunit [Candidatus Aminicenantes bacterium]|nr:MAG: efflux RND transporter permease subunit [Candidatus Aminicenantes bacterium]